MDDVCPIPRSNREVSLLFPPLFASSSSCGLSSCLLYPSCFWIKYEISKSPVIHSTTYFFCHFDEHWLVTVKHEDNGKALTQSSQEQLGGVSPGPTTAPLCGLCCDAASGCPFWQRSGCTGHTCRTANCGEFFYENLHQAAILCLGAVDQYK